MLLFVFIIHPLCVKISHPEIRIATHYIHGIASFDFISWSGPLRFALALLIFTFGYVFAKNTFGSFNFG
ncbi:MAG: hypothetical protein A4E53_04400 [Pelotomaculum sp. PtaB.Bin104]|nr:MAG: hypothetical protein A4E53_04400 [Pelotomaculum sp. PtaB.Bin104]